MEIGQLAYHARPTLRGLAGAAAAVSLSIAAGAAAAGTADAALCADAARRAAAETGVPADLLRALLLVESGRSIGGALVGWPWAVNVGGRGSWHPDAASARRAIDAVPRDGAEHVDIGCFQLNRRWHGHHFPDTAAMLDPDGNARHAARFLLALRDEFGSWEAASGAYHSRDPARSAAYAARVAAHRAADDPQAQAPPPMRQDGRRGFPLLLAEAPAAGPSLFPAAAQDGAPIVRAARPLIGGG